MVEGPGCKLKGEKLRSKVTGQSVRQVSGNAVERESKSCRKPERFSLQNLVGKSLEDIQTLGKELFMYFGIHCLRVHFLMNGSFKINDKLSDPDAGRNKSQTPSLVLHLSQDTVAFYDSSVEIRPSQLCRDKHEELKSLDICSPLFSHKRAVNLIIAQKGRQLCDVLLDQLVLPGVGNIIKNEAFFDSGIKPDSKVEDLKEEHVSHLVKMTRDFSMLFYQCRKTGVSLNKYMKVYSREKCGQCQGKVVICRMGDDNDRVTYFCPNCQTNDLRNNKQILPTKNSLLGWLKTGSPVSQPDWSCATCTLVNKASQTSCIVCLTPRTTKERVQGPSNMDQIGPTDQCRKQSFGDPGEPLVPNSISSSDSKFHFSRKVLSSGAPPSGKRKANFDGQPKPLATINAGPGLMETNQARKKLKITATGSVNNSCDGSGSTHVATDVKSKIPSCPGHKKKCLMKEVRKEGENNRRMFFVCPQSRGKQCDYFKWADESFPICAGHGKPCALRTVMKQGPNNGRKFFTCPMSKPKQCQFFEWAAGYG